MTDAAIAVHPGPEAAPALVDLLPPPVPITAADALVLLDTAIDDALLDDVLGRGLPVLATGGAALQLARLAGGAVEPGTAPQFGFVDVEALAAAKADPLTAACGDGLPLLVWHEDAIVLPPGGELLLRCERGRIQGFRHGRAHGFRFRPELDGPAVRALATERAARLNNIGYRVRLVSEIERHMARQIACARALVVAWLRQVRSGAVAAGAVAR